MKDFKAMEDAAESFTNQWAGASKAEFITAAYDVKSALESLSDQAVGTFAAMAAITGKATKATTQEMVETFTTAYGIFKPIMSDVSDMDWAEMFSGALSETVGVFKTSGPAMAEAIKNIGAIAAASNIPLQEQMAILGQLQTTMPGSEAGTLYKAFMLKVAEAGEELGLSFIGPTGRLKDIVSILEELKRGFPDLSDAMVQVKLKRAFGSDEAVRFLLQMSMGLDQLQGNIRSIETAMKDGTAVTLEMAHTMNMDIGSQLTLVKQQVANLAEILGRTLLPVVIPVIQSVSRFILYLQGVATAAPGVTKVILTLFLALGAVLVAFGSVTAAIGTIGIMLPALKVGIAALGPMLAGVGSAVSAYLWPVIAIIAAVVIAVIALKHAWETNFGGIRDTVMGVWNKVNLAFQGIRVLIGSLSDGSGQMSAELAKKLESAGLMKFVTTVFQVYYRVRQFLMGLWQAFSSAFGKVRAILEPAAKSLMGAFAELGKALVSVFGIFGKTATSVDSSTFKSLGQTLGKVLGVILQFQAYVLKFVIYPLVFVIRVVALVVRAVAWLGGVIIRAFVAAAPYVYKFFLPLRMLVQGLILVGSVAHKVWQMVTGQVSAFDGLKSIGGAIFQYLATPFRWVRDVASATWDFLRKLFSSIAGLFQSPGRTLLESFSFVFSSIGSIVSDVWNGISNTFSSGWNSIISIGSAAYSMVAAPFRWIAGVAAAAWGRIVGIASSAWSAVRSAASSAFASILSGLSGLVTGAFASGRAMMTTIASGIRSAVSIPYDTLKSALSRLRKLLPFSDAKEGPLSALTRSGTAMLEAFSSGIARASKLPSQAFEQAIGFAKSAALPTAALGTLALTPTIAGAIPEPTMPIVAAQEASVSTQDHPSQVEQSRLLSVTRGALGNGPERDASGQTQDLRPILEAILSKLDGVAERPIEVTVTTTLDGRKIAQAVYRDMRERKVRNYESA